MTDKIQQYLDDYIRESKQHLDQISHALLALEKVPDDPACIDELFRHAHTLKSISGLMKFEQTTQLCHAFENLLDSIKKKQLSSKNHIDLFFNIVDMIEKNIGNAQNHKKALDTTTLSAQIEKILANQSQDSATSITQTTKTALTTIDKVSSINVKVERLDSLMNLSEEFIINKMKLDLIKSKFKDKALNSSLLTFDRLINELQYLVVHSRLVPIDYIFNRFPRMVRDIAKSQNKQIDVQLQGGATELDRAIIDELGECLVHLLRNAVDHGIESKATRKKNHKFDMATINIQAQRKRDQVLIEVSDDGAGLPMAKIRQKAKSLGLLSANSSDHKLAQTIFLGISTADEISEISGRGFGLMIVKQKVSALGGSVSVSSAPGKGCTFTLKLPLTLAIIKVLFVLSGGEKYAIPINHIQRLIRIPTASIKQLLKKEAIVLDGQQIPLIRLEYLFGQKITKSQRIAIVILKQQNKFLGVAVDEFSVMQDVVVKPMNKALQQNRYFSGSTIVGDGKVILILDVMNLSLPVVHKKT